MHYTKNNHLFYTIGNRKFGYRKDAHEQYKVFCGQADPAIYKESSWYNELLKTADTVLNEYGKDLVLFLSGGTDSEIVLRNFLEIGHSPRCVTIKFKNDYNAPDVIEAETIAKDLGVKLDIIEFDVKEFYNSGEAASFAEEIDCTQITYLMVYYHIKKLGFPAVMGGEQLLKRHVHPQGSYWYHCFRENEDASAMRFSEKFKIPLVNEWFSYTPEMMLYYLEDDDIKNLITTRYNYKITSVSSKNDILKRLYPSIRTKIKTHGFERLLGFNLEAYNNLRQVVVNRKESSLDGMPIEELLNHLRGNI
jgi:hypothetical protein